MKKMPGTPQKDKLRKVIERTSEGEVYEYYPLGRYVVIAPGVCGGRPTIRGTRVEVRALMGLLRNGWAINEIVQNYPRIPPKAVEEAIALATRAFNDQFALKAA
jgi:uncharacterized protein (DUF433 family)